MHLIESLVAGIRGAENGTVSLFRRGTSQGLTWYSDFEATQGYTTTVLLDANGAAVVYISELATVIVDDSDGIELRRFVAGVSASAVEVISDSFTGVDYVTGASGVSKPTTLAAVLDLWNDSAGTSNFKATVGGASKAITSALAGSALYFNVKDTAYGAVGDGATDDTSAIQAAVNAAAAAGGGTVFFPSGTYRTTSTITVGATVSLLGNGPSASVILLDHATASIITLGSSFLILPYPSIAGLRIAASQVNTGSAILASGVTADRLIFNCYLGSQTTAAGDIISVTTGGTIVLVGCYLRAQGASARCFVGVDIKAYGTTFTVPDGIAYNPTSGVLVSTRVQLANCQFDNTGPTSGTYSSVRVAGAATGGGSIVGCGFAGNSAATVTAIRIGTYSNLVNWGFVESGNVFGISLTPYAYTVDVGTSGLECTLSTREDRRTYTTVAGNTTLSASQYGTIVAQVTVNSAVALTLDAAPEGAHLTLIMDNDFAGVTGTITPSANVRGLAAFTVNNATLSVYRFVSAAVDGTLQWLLMGSSVNI